MQYNDPQVSPAYQLWLASNAWQRILRRALEPFDLTHVQFVILISIDMMKEKGCAATQSAICRFADLDENMTSQVTRTLMKRGLVLREDHPTDGRAYVLSLTQEGQTLTHQARSVTRPATQEFFAPLEDRMEEFVGLMRLLTSDRS